MQGTVKFFSQQKGYGFIEVEGEDDHFVHVSELPNGVIIEEGDEVEFDSERGEKGMKATNLELVEEE